MQAGFPALGNEGGKGKKEGEPARRPFCVLFSSVRITLVSYHDKLQDCVHTVAIDCLQTTSYVLWIVVALLFYYSSIYRRNLALSTMVYYFTDLILGLVSRAKSWLGSSPISQIEVSLSA